jgi:hypothetical protein
VKDGKDITITGCLATNPGGGYMLTDRKGDQKYALVTDDDLAKHVGHWMEVKGKAADRGDGKVKIESTTGTSGSENDQSEDRAQRRRRRHELSRREIGEDDLQTCM